jgi:hypothetical protein
LINQHAPKHSPFCIATWYPYKQSWPTALLLLLLLLAVVVALLLLLLQLLNAKP